MRVDRVNLRRAASILVVALLAAAVAGGACGRKSAVRKETRVERPAPPVAPSTAPAAVQPDEAQAEVDRALSAPGWVQLPPQIIDVRYGGPTPAAAPGSPPGPAWYVTVGIDGNSRPHANPRQEAAFVESVEAAFARRTRVIRGGIVLLVDPAGRIWGVAAHTPHLLRCFDGRRWTFRRADGLPAAADEPAAFARLADEGKLPKPDIAAGGLRDRNDLGRWYPAACADRAGNLHFVAACVSRDAETRGAGGGGVHTLRPNGAWSFFRVYPQDMPRSDMRLEALRWIIHRAGGDLMTLAEFQLSDPVAEMHGHTVEPVPDDGDPLRQQLWKERTEEPRSGPSYFLRFDGRPWRFDRSSVGWGPYDMVLRSWPQPDGRVYLVNRFGLWVQWPRDVPTERFERLIADVLGNDEAARTAAADTLVSMGRLSAPILAEAAERAESDRARDRLTDLAKWATKAARGEADAVPVVGGRWRFFDTYPQATMPDGRFAFFCQRANDVRAGTDVNDCLVFFDPAKDAFEVRAIDRTQWNAADFEDKRPNEAPVKSLDDTVVDLGGGLWVPGGNRCGPDGRITRLVPPGLAVRLPHFVDPAGRVYFHGASPGGISLYALHPDRPTAPASPAPAATRPVDEKEVHVQNVGGLFLQPDVAPPWSAWAIQRRDGQPNLLLRLDGPEPTRVEPPPPLKDVTAVVPVEGGCVAASRSAAGFWNGREWDVAPDLKTLVERHGRRLAESVPTRVFARHTSDSPHGYYFRHQLMLASDGRGGLWLAEDVGRARRLWHWDGEDFTDLWTLLPLKHERNEDGAVMTAHGGRALIVQLEQNMDVRPGGYWAIWNVSGEDLKDGQVVPQTAHKPGLKPQLLAARGPNTMFSQGLWVDRQGWVWSPIFSNTGQQWVRRLDNRLGYTALPQMVWSETIVQGAEGPAWCVTGAIGNKPMVWVDVGPPPGEEPKTFPRMVWAGAQIPGMGPAARLAVGPDGQVYLLHEAGCSLLRLRKLATGEKPKLPTRVLSGQGGEAPTEQWEIQEVARRPWDGPRNDFDRIAFDDGGVWFLPRGGPLIRAPLPRE